MSTTWLTYPQAARRTGRAVRTLQLWRAEGMPVRVRQGRVEVQADVLAQWERNKRFQNPKRPKRAA